jgi:hypothetical protein
MILGSFIPGLPSVQIAPSICASQIRVRAIQRGRLWRAGGFCRLRSFEEGCDFEELWGTSIQRFEEKSLQLAERVGVSSESTAINRGKE